MTAPPVNVTFPLVADERAGIVQGFSHSHQLWMFQSDGVTPVNLTGFGATWAATIKPIGSFGATGLAMAVDSSTAASGYVTVSLTAAQTAQLTQTVGTQYDGYVYDVGTTDTPFPVFRALADVDGSY